MISQIKSLVKQPAFWVLLAVGILAATAYSKLRAPFKAIATKLPGADVQ